MRTKELERTARKGWFATPVPNRRGHTTPQGVKGKHQGQSGEQEARKNVNKTFILVFTGRNGQDKVAGLGLAGFNYFSGL